MCFAIEMCLSGMNVATFSPTPAKQAMHLRNPANSIGALLVTSFS